MTANVSHYRNLIHGARELKENNNSRRTRYYRLQPVDRFIVDPLTEIISDRLTLPILLYSYRFTTKTTVWCVSKFSSQKSTKLQEACYDPISTSTLIKLCQWVQKTVRSLAKRQPTWLPVLEYPDTCVVVAARHLLILSRDIEAVLNLPHEIRTHTDEICAPTEVEFSTTVHNRQNSESDSYWDWFVDKCKEGLVVSKDYVVSTAQQLKVRVTNITKDAIRQKTYAMVESRERMMRMAIVGKVVKVSAKKSTDLIIRSAIRALLGIAFYHFTLTLLEKSFSPEREISITLTHHAAQGVSLFLTVMGAMLWMHCLTPSIRRLYQAKELQFDPDTSTFKELSTLLGKQSTSQLMLLAFQFLFSKEQDLCLLEKFVESLGKISASSSQS